MINISKLYCGLRGQSDDLRYRRDREVGPVLERLRNKDRFADPRCLACQWFRLCKGNYRFLDSDPADANWLNEPACYLTDKETGFTASE